MRKNIPVFCLFVLTLLLGACSKNGNQTGPQPSKSSAYITFVHACTEAGNLSATVNDVVYGYTMFGAVQASQHVMPVNENSTNNVAFKITANGSVLVSYATRIATDGSYTIFACGTVAAPDFVFTENNTLADKNAVLVRFVNVSPDQLSKYCSVDGAIISSAFPYKTVTPYYTIKASSSATILVKDSNNPQNVAAVVNQNLQAGKIYTFYLANTDAAAGPSGMVLQTILENPDLPL